MNLRFGSVQWGERWERRRRGVPSVAFCLGAPRPARSALCRLPSPLRGSAGTVSSDPLAEPPGSRSLALSPKLLCVRRLPAVLLSKGGSRPRVRARAEGSRRAGPRPRRAHTHPLLAAGGRAGGSDRFLGPRLRGPLGRWRARGPARGEGRRGAAPEGRGAPPSALSRAAVALCVPL